jgi:hypothetical protein
MKILTTFPTVRPCCLSANVFNKPWPYGGKGSSQDKYEASFGYPLPWGVLVDYSRTTFGSADTKQLEKGVYSLLQIKSRPV